jgi:hypothetical protein
MAFWGGEGLGESVIRASFARPGANVTGVYMLASELEAKRLRLELLLEVILNGRKIAILNPRRAGSSQRSAESRKRPRSRST